MSISQCELNIRKYCTLKSNIISIANYLSIASNSIDNYISNIKNKYQVNDDSTPIVTNSNELKEKIRNTYFTLINNVVPAIDSAVSELNKRIELLLEEQRRLEEAERELERKSNMVTISNNSTSNIVKKSTYSSTSKIASISINSSKTVVSNKATIQNNNARSKTVTSRSSNNTSITSSSSNSRGKR